MLAAVALRRSARLDAMVRRVEELEERVEVLRRRGLAAAAPIDEAVAPAADTAGAQVGPGVASDAEPGAAEVPPVAAADEPPPPDDGVGPFDVPSAPPLQIDWERWIGVRGAAVLGGVVLALAGLFFFRYSIEHGLVPPWLRVAMGTVAGCAALGIAERLLRREYEGTANALAGAGVVILYAAFWAAANRYDLVGPGALFVLLVAVTAACGALSWRHRSVVIAVFGLVGGFLTPFFASRGGGNPLGLFAYVLLLDVAVLWIARRRGWPLLALLALAGTAAWQVLWIGFDMGPERLLLGLGVLAVFALAFAAGGPRRDDGGGRGWAPTRAGSVLVPFGFALYVAASTDLGARLLPLAGLLALLALAGGWLAREHDEPLLVTSVAGAVLAVLVTWAGRNTITPALAWQLAGAGVVLGAIFQLHVARAADGRWRGAGLAAAAGGAGLLALLVVAGATAPDDVPLWPWLAGWLGLAAILLRSGGRAGRGWLQLVAALGPMLGLAVVRGLDERSAAMLPLAGHVTLVVGVAVGFQLVALRRDDGVPRRFGERAAALAALVGMLFAVAPLDDPGGVRVPVAALVLGLLALLAATRLVEGWWALAAVVATALTHTAWAMFHPHRPLAGLLLLGLGVVGATAWPLVVVARVRDDRRFWWAAALAGPLWFPAILTLFERRFGDAVEGVVPLALGAATLAAAQRARALFPPGDPARTSNLAWLLGVTTGFVTVAIPLQLAREWITIGWALEGAALVVLWRRLDHPGLKWVGIALLLAVTVRLVANPDVLAYHPRGAWRVLNWVLYTYLVPAAALLFASTRLATHEVPRLRDWERGIFGARAPGAAVTGLAGLGVVFAWLNLAIADWFAGGPTLALDLERLPARDLTTSIAWAVYALALLGLGVRLASVGLRWASLGLLMLTIAKVFLYDLGELRDLYRVASLLGLAVSLIVVSLAYQHFVLGRPRVDR